MQIQTVKVGELRTNCYIVSDSDKAIVIDPGFEPEKILPYLKDLKIIAIVLTHGHYDHVTESFKLKEIINVPVYIHELDEPMLTFTIQERADKLLHEKDIINFGNSHLVVIHTPGHTAGGICLYNSKEQVIFTGDTLFYHDYGRTDFPGGSNDAMKSSLEKLKNLPAETKVYPGHGRQTTIGDEKDLGI